MKKLVFLHSEVFHNIEPYFGYMLYIRWTDSQREMTAKIPLCVEITLQGILRA